MKRSDMLRTALTGLAVLTLPPGAAFAGDDVRVRVPYGVDVSGTTTSSAPDGMLYVTVTGLTFANPSTQAQSYRATDLHLRASGRSYEPVVRPHLGAIDAIEPGIVGPRETLRISATFLLPAGVSRADLEFTPRWSDDNGRSIDFCCYYL